MAEKIVSTQITDHVDGQPAIVMSNGNWGVFDPKTNMYKDNGIKASPEDDATAIKYYKLGNTSTPPEAPTRAGGWDSLTTLNASLAQADWDEDPLTTSKTNKFCWIAFYGKENVVDVSATESAGHLIFKPKYTRTKVSLWSNYADSPTISVVGNEIIITNPDGTVVTQKFATTEAIADIANLIASLQEQMDGSVYSYSLEGEPSMTKAPVTTWINGVDPSLIADIYSQHVGDTYTDLLTYVSYRFALISGSASDPMNYGWKVIEDSALTNALGEIARLGREKVTIFTETPTAYSKGDMWLQPDNTMKIAIASRETFSEADWLQPYATKLEVSAIRDDLTAAQTDATSAKNQIGELVLGLTTMDGEVADAIKDNIISDTEMMDLKSELKQLDIDQETLLTTVTYLLSSTYLPTEPKATLQTRSNASIGAGGSMDIYQAQISTMITDRVITAQERADYLSKFNTYKNDLKLLNEAISGASSAIEGELKRLADEKVDNLEIGGRNLLPAFTSDRWIHLPQTEVDDYSLYFPAEHAGDSRIFIDVEKETNYTMSFNSDYSRYYIHEVLDDGSLAGRIRAAIGSEVHTFNTGNVNNIRIRIDTFSEDAHEEKNTWNLKLEKGTKPTDWSPAPEDVQASIDEAVIKATYWSIKSSSPVIYKDSNSATASGVHTPVTVNGELRSGTTTTQGGFISIQPNGGTESTATASPRTIAPTDIEGKTSYTVRLYEKADKATLLDTMTIPVVFKGSSGINVAMSNEADVLPASPTGEVTDYADTGNVIRVFEGAKELQYSVTAGNGKYNVTAVGTGITVGTKSASGLACSFANASNMTTDSAKIVFTISGKTSDGTSFSFDKTQNFSKSKIGADGKGIVSIKEFYAVSASSTTEPTDWSETVPQMTASDKYLWNYEEITYTTGAPTTSKKKVIGVFGDKGGEGKGIASIKNYYLASSLSTGITRETSGWKETVQMISPTEKYLWNYETITYTAGSPTNTDPVVIGTYGEQGADGSDGEGGINVMITRQGSFRTYWRQIGDQGQILTAPEKVSEIIGGVEIGSVKYVQCKVIIYKGSVDVTASALADPTTLPKWYLNNTLMGSVTDTLNIPITHADGKDDEVRFEYTDTNAKNWEGV